ncbi:helix-turn-helix domain-containing protein [Halomonas sp. RA08-2]|uniref:helix-turn-helix domain-containing protein n=1 Tax=Halomonas sp. RA08-2 TaxID=3440842 RepID=UPI003EEC6BF1
MTAPVDYRISEEEGRRFAVVPLEQFTELIARAGEADAPTLPHEVISRHLADNVPLVRCWREHLGMTQTELAGRLAVSQAQVAQWERHDANLRRNTLQKLATALGIHMQQLSLQDHSSDFKRDTSPTRGCHRSALQSMTSFPGAQISKAKGISDNDQPHKPRPAVATCSNGKGLIINAMKGQPTKEMADHLEIISKDGGVIHGKEMLLQMAYELRQLPSSEEDDSTTSEYTASMCWGMVRQLWKHVPDDQLGPMSNGQFLLVLGYLYGTLTRPSHDRYSKTMESEIKVLQANLKRQKGWLSSVETKQAETAKRMAEGKRIWDELIRAGRSEHGLPQVVQDRLAARGVRVSVDTVARWARKGGWRSKTKKRTR